MSGIQLVQGSTTINAGGTQSPSVQSGAIIGSTATLSFTGTSASYAWVVSRPNNAANDVSSSTAAAPTILFDYQGLWTIQLTDASGNVYTLPLSVTKVDVTSFTGPVFPAYCTPAQVATPGLGQSIYQNSSNSGALMVKDVNAASYGVCVARYGTTGARPTAGLYTGYTYFDTTLAKPIWRSAVSTWVDATGATV